MDPELLQALNAYFQSDPGFSKEYHRHMDWARTNAPGDHRSETEWMYDFLQDPKNQNAVENFNGFLSSQGGQTPQTPQAPEETSTDVPLEQGLLDMSLPGLLQDVEGDANRALMAQALQAQNQGDYDLARQLILRATSGQQLTTELNAADTAATSKTGALDDALEKLRAAQKPLSEARTTAATDANASKVTALEDELTKLNAAQDPLSQARLAEAESAVTGVNLGLERTNDQLDADRALQGYVGGSTMDQNALARAAIDARQRGASLVGAAKTANAGDVRNIAGYGASQGYSLAGSLADQLAAAQVQNATDDRSIGGYGADQGYSIASSLADQKMGLTNADYGRSLQAALSLPQITNQYLGTQNNIDSQRNAGLNRTLGVLNWWSAPGTAPTAGYAPVSANNSGNDISGLGAGLTSAALNIGNANKWWQTPKSAATTGFTTPGGNVGVQTDWSQAFAA